MSELSSAIREYLDLRRSLGYKLLRHDAELEDFANFMSSRSALVITTRLALEWVQQKPEQLPATRAKRLGVVRGFTHYHRASHPDTEVPPRGLLPTLQTRKSPHLYAEDEIAHLMDAARGLRGPNGVPPEDALRPWTYSTLLGLLVVTGLRLGEALELQRDAVDFPHALLTVQRAKFGKSRLVPLHETTVSALQRYAVRRDRLHPRARTPLFFVGQHGGHLDQRTVERTFIRLSRQVGLRGATDRNGPRIHDFRHTFAMKSLVRCYEEAADVGPQLPVLSTFLGHTHMADTYWYLSASPGLLALAGSRLERLMEVFS